MFFIVLNFSSHKTTCSGEVTYIYVKSHEIKECNLKVYIREPHSVEVNRLNDGIT